MRLVRFGVAMSLDGYIAGPQGEFDWIVMDPDIDFAGMQAQFDTFLMGRKTFEAMAKTGGKSASPPGVRNIVLSRTLQASDYPHITVRSDAERLVAELRAQPGTDISVFGGGELFRSLLAAGLVDRVEVAVIPVLLGGGIPLLPSPAGRTALKLQAQRVYDTTGTVALEYDVVRWQAFTATLQPGSRRGLRRENRRKEESKTLIPEQNAFASSLLRFSPRSGARGHATSSVTVTGLHWLSGPGIVRQMVEPDVSGLSAQIRPLWASMMQREM